MLVMQSPGLHDEECMHAGYAVCGLECIHYTLLATLHSASYIAPCSLKPATLHLLLSNQLRTGCVNARIILSSSDPICRMYTRSARMVLG